MEEYKEPTKEEIEKYEEKAAETMTDRQTVLSILREKKASMLKEETGAEGGLYLSIDKNQPDTLIGRLNGHEVKLSFRQYVKNVDTEEGTKGLVVQEYHANVDGLDLDEETSKRLYKKYAPYTTSQVVEDMNSLNSRREIQEYDKKSKIDKIDQIISDLL